MNENNNKTEVQEHHSELEKTHDSSRRLGTITILLIFGLFGIWSVFAEISTTISANGKVITHSYNKIVMHPRGGIVKNIFIKEGDLVKKDQALLELDSTESTSQLNSNIKKHDVNLFTICKLKSEFRLDKELDCTKYENDIIDKNSLLRIKENTQLLFTSDLQNLKAKIDLLKSKNNVLNAQNNGYTKQIESNQKLLLSYQKELKKWKKLLKSNAVDELKLIDTERKIVQVNLQIGMLQSSINENLVTIKSNEQQITLEKETFKNAALVKLNDVELENALIRDSITTLRNTVDNATVKSPSDGLVTDMKIHANREVVSPLKQIMSIVPDDKKLMIEAYILPSDIEKIYKGQKTEVSFPAFVNPSAIPMEGKLTYVSADTITQEGSQESLYVVFIELTPKGFEAIRKNDFKIIPGMQAAAFIKTGNSTLMAYLMNPIIQMFKGIYHAN